MGKAENVLPLQSTAHDAQGANPDAGSSNGCCLSCSRVRKWVTLRCVAALVLGVAVILSAVFWLPFFRVADHTDLDLDYEGYDVVASFMLKKSKSFLSDYKLQLANDISDEIPFSSTKVEIISLDSAGPNITKVVFSVESDVTARSLIRENFVSLISNQSVLHLTAPLFGDPFSFEVLQFKGGITVSPDQKAFLMQNVKIPFNFTLNFSIDRLLNNFDELTSQLKAGLRLTPYENLFIGLTNLKGSTVKPPTTVQSQVVLAVGINPSRLKQLAQTITGSHTKNLGLNNTVFGRVKQVRLSSILQHSLGNAGSSPSPSPLPSPSPMSKPHHHHHHHHHHHAASLSPTVSPSPSTTSGGQPVSGKGSPASTPVPVPAPAPGKATEPPCPFGYNNRYPWKHKHSHTAPTSAPVYAPYIAPSRPRQTDKPAPKISPVKAESPSPKVAYAHSRAPSQSEYHARPPDVMSIISPSPSPSSAKTISSKIWAVLLFILLGMAL
ncbi:hydroxyproline-rich glycoprotein family protein [Perilla frutescens var. frutescens]|nr:hydroxyproline-rich glycoprotein family protein [Perilla frutescens var. frutescens]